VMGEAACALARPGEMVAASVVAAIAAFGFVCQVLRGPLSVMLDGATDEGRSPYR
jgi:hypothetical protein